MIFLGVDVGYGRCGWGVVEDNGNGLSLVQYGVIQTNADQPFPLRLRTVKEMIVHLAGGFSVDVLAVERPVHGRNVTNSAEVGAAYGAVLLASTEMTLPLLIYWPSTVKAAIAKGNAKKKVIQEQVKLILGLPKVPKPDDAADGLAVAICAANRWQHEVLQKV